MTGDVDQVTESEWGTIESEHAAPSVAVPGGAIPGGRAYAGSELMSAATPHRFLPTLVAAAAVAVVAGCGPGAILTAESPDQAVSTALQAVQTTPLRMSLTGDLHLDTASLTNLPASIQTILGQVGSGGSATGILEQESGARRQLTVSAAGHSLALVEYDGHLYVSQDGGAYAELPQTPQSSPEASPPALATAVAALGFQDQGSATVDGVSAEHYTATITVATLEKLAQDLTSGGGSGSLEQGLTLLAPYATGQGSVDVWLSERSGSLVRAELSGSLTVNVGAAVSALSGLLAPASGSSGALPGGSLGVSLSLRADVSDYGGAITVTKPDATSTLPSGGLPGWLGSSLGGSL